MQHAYIETSKSKYFHWDLNNLKYYCNSQKHWHEAKYIILNTQLNNIIN